MQKSCDQKEVIVRIWSLELSKEHTFCFSLRLISVYSKNMCPDRNSRNSTNMDTLDSTKCTKTSHSFYFTGL